MYASISKYLIRYKNRMKPNVNPVKQCYEKVLIWIFLFALNQLFSEKNPFI